MKTDLVKQCLESCGYEVHVYDDIAVEAHHASINTMKYIKVILKRQLVNAWDIDFNAINNFNNTVYNSLYFENLQELRKCIINNKRLQLSN